MLCFLFQKCYYMWIAPICPHTAEEAWQHIPRNKDKSIFFNKWLELDLINDFNKCNISDSDWNDILEVKKTVSKSLRRKKNRKILLVHL